MQNDNNENPSSSESSPFREEVQQPLNERHYMRGYVNEQRQRMVKAVSEQVMKGEEFNFFREMEDERIQQMD